MNRHAYLPSWPRPATHFTTALRARLAAGTRRLVEQRYDWDAIGRRFTALVEETVAHRRMLAATQD